MKVYKIGIMGCGHIAEKMAATLNAMEGVECHAVASRNKDKARAFAEKWHFAKAYGSYGELVDDAETDLIYIATPHSQHFDNACMCIGKGKPVLCEKSFTANAAQAEKLLKLAEEKGVFITEAIWTRYMPLSVKMQQLLQEGAIGRPHMLTANLGYDIDDKERIRLPELGGGALLDIGVYTLNFAAMAFGTEVSSWQSACQLTDTGVDAQENITFFYGDGRMAALQATIYAQTDRQGVITGDKGYMIVDNINNPASLRIVDTDYHTVARHEAPPQITGFEYQVEACMEALANGWTESPYMPHRETLRIMRLMDALRKEWGVAYPCDAE